MWEGHQNDEVSKGTKEMGILHVLIDKTLAKVASTHTTEMKKKKEKNLWSMSLPTCIGPQLRQYS